MAAISSASRRLTARLSRMIVPPDQELFLLTKHAFPSYIRGIYGLTATSITGRLLVKLAATAGIETIGVRFKAHVEHAAKPEGEVFFEEAETLWAKESHAALALGDHYLDFDIPVPYHLPDTTQHPQARITYTIQGVLTRKGRSDVATSEEEVHLFRFLPLDDGSNGETCMWLSDANRNIQAMVRMPKEPLLTPEAMVPIHVQLTTMPDTIHQFSVHAELHQMVFRTDNGRCDSEVVSVTEQTGTDDEEQRDLVMELFVPSEKLNATSDAGSVCIAHRIVVRLDFDRDAPEMRIAQPCVVTTVPAVQLRDAQLHASAKDIYQAKRYLAELREWTRTAATAADYVPATPNSLKALPDFSKAPDVDGPSDIVKEIDIVPLEGRSTFITGYHGLGTGAKCIGNVTLVLTRRVCARRITIQVIGLSYLHSKETVRTREPALTRTLVDKSTDLWVGQGDEWNLDVGRHSFKFEIPLDTYMNLPESCFLHENRGGIKYFLRVQFWHVGAYGLVQRSMERSFQLVRCLLVQSPMANTPQVVQENMEGGDRLADRLTNLSLEQEDTLGVGIMEEPSVSKRPPLPLLKTKSAGVESSAHGVCYSVLLPHCVFGPDDEILVEVKASHVDSAVKVRGFRVELVEESRFRHRAGNLGPEGKQVRVLARVDQLLPKRMTYVGDEEEAGVAQLKLIRPKDAEATVIDGNLVEIRHRLHVRVRVDGRGVDAECSFPVALTSVDRSIGERIVQRIGVDPLHVMDDGWLRRVLQAQQ